MEYKFIAKLELILPYNIKQIMKRRVKSYSVGSEWAMAERSHPQYKNYEVVLINKNNRWLGLSKQELNYLFEVEVI